MYDWLDGEDAASAHLDLPRPIFRELLEIDDATWARGRGWALSQAVIALPYCLHTYPMVVRDAWRWLAEVLADLPRGGRR